MTKNIIFYFSGTGNCLQVSKELAKELGECEIVSMGSHKGYELNDDYESVGFIFPTYFQGIPDKVRKFISKLKSNGSNTYCYAITTYGLLVGNALSQINRLLFNQGIHLNYSAKLEMFSNYVVMYNMKKNVDAITSKSLVELKPIIQAIKLKTNNSIKKENSIFAWYYQKRICNIHDEDKNFVVSNECISCGICEKVCPVKNIQMKNKKPTFQHNCEQCMACIQFCPKKAINYKTVTKKRRRYTNPSIDYKELHQRNSK